MNQDIYVLIEHIRGNVSDISYMNLAQAHALGSATGGQVVGVLLGHKAQELANGLDADSVLYVDDSAMAEFNYEAYLKVLSSLLKDKAPRAMLFGDTTVGADIASSLSAALDFPVISFCAEVKGDGGALKYVSHICAGKLHVEGPLPDQTTLLTMVPGRYRVEEGKSDKAHPLTILPTPDMGDLKIALIEYEEPSAEDVDISSEPILIAVGRGLMNQDDLEIVEDLAEVMGGTVCASRPVVDQRWLPSTRLVGKSGKVVKPKIYLALGISGAPEHVESITGSEMIIAVNTDPNAPIFNLAKYGIEEDMLDVAEALSEAIQEARGG
jgi:electron transfer flavoprotein alpha subunit